MRILHLTDFYPPTRGGLELHVQWLARGLVRRGHHVSVICMAPGGVPRFEIDEDVRVHRVIGWNGALLSRYQSSDRPYHPTVPDPGLLGALKRVIAEERPDVVHAHSWILYSYLPIKPRNHRPLVVSLHEYGLVCAKKTFIHRGQMCSGAAFLKCVRCASEQYGWPGSVALTSGLRLMHHFRRGVDRYIANSRSVAEASMTVIRGDTPIEVIPPFLPDEELNIPAGPPPVFVPRSDFILFVGGLGPMKGLDVLLEAYGKLRRKPGLLLIGTRREGMPPQLPDGVVMVENVSHEEVMRAWAECSVAVVPSRSEGFGLVAVEAMAAGRPVVASSVGGLPEIVVDGETGLLVPPGDVPRLRDAIAMLLDDRPLRQTMGERGRERASAFRASAVIPRIERVYTELLGSPHRPRSAG